MIRVARPEGIASLSDIERAAGAAFRDVDMAAIADDEPLPEHVLLGYQQARRSWVATNSADRPVTYLVADLVDMAAHGEQVSVHPDHARQGFGRQLLATTKGWSRLHGLTALTLTTFTDVPWNGPYYASLGFEVVAENEWTPGQRRIREHETTLGLDAWPRAVMRRRTPNCGAI